MMRAWLVDQFGEPDAIRLGDAPDPQPQPGEVLIDVRASGINFFDLLQIRGQYQYKPPFPYIPGAEVAGVIAATGERVMAFTAQGGYADKVTAPATHVFPIPDGMDFAAAAAFLIVYHTGWFVLNERVRLMPGECLLVQAGASGTGMAAIQIALTMGARVLATAGSAEKLALCRELGAEAAFDYSHPAWVDEVKAATGGRGVDVIYDPVGGDIFDQSSKCLAMEGRIAVVGFTSGRIPTIAANRLLLKNISVVGAVWGTFQQAHPGYMAATQTALAALIGEGHLKPRIGQTFAFEDARSALLAVDQRRVFGKAVLLH